MKILPRNIAREQNISRFFTGEPCTHGHISERVTSSGACVECNRERSAKWNESNRDRQRESMRSNYDSDPEYYKKKARLWEKENSERARDIKRESKRRERNYSRL